MCDGGLSSAAMDYTSKHIWDIDVIPYLFPNKILKNAVDVHKIDIKIYFSPYIYP
jgi:hypothetical protein